MNIEIVPENRVNEQIRVHFFGWLDRAVSEHVFKNRKNRGYI